MTDSYEQGRSIMERPAKKISWSEFFAALFCLAATSGYLYQALNLAARSSRGDVGPAALPYGVAVCGIALSVILLVLAFRAPVNVQGPNFPAIDRVVLFVGAFFIVPIASQYIGLAVALGVAGGLVTLIFSGNRKWARALSTAVVMWLIAELLFTRFLGLPLP